MNPNAARRLLAAKIAELDPKWDATVVSRPELNGDLTAQIGHFAPTLATFQSGRFQVPVTWWANEGNAVENVDEFYAALSWDTDSLIYRLAEVEWVGQIEMRDADSPDEVPQFVRCETVVTIKAGKLPAEPVGSDES